MNNRKADLDLVRSMHPDIAKELDEQGLTEAEDQLLGALLAPKPGQEEVIAQLHGYTLEPPANDAEPPDFDGGAQQEAAQAEEWAKAAEQKLQLEQRINADTEPDEEMDAWSAEQVGQAIAAMAKEAKGTTDG